MEVSGGAATSALGAVEALAVVVPVAAAGVAASRPPRHAKHARDMLGAIGRRTHEDVEVAEADDLCQCWLQP